MLSNSLFFNNLFAFQLIDVTITRLNIGDNDTLKVYDDDMSMEERELRYYVRTNYALPRVRSFSSSDVYIELFSVLTEFENFAKLKFNWEIIKGKSYVTLLYPPYRQYLGEII